VTFVAAFAEVEEAAIEVVETVTRGELRAWTVVSGMKLSSTTYYSRIREIDMYTERESLHTELEEEILDWKTVTPFFPFRQIAYYSYKKIKIKIFIERVTY
jgi:hypothetical protein